MVPTFIDNKNPIGIYDFWKYLNKNQLNLLKVNC